MSYLPVKLNLLRRWVEREFRGRDIGWNYKGVIATTMWILVNWRCRAAIMCLDCRKKEGESPCPSRWRASHVSIRNRRTCRSFFRTLGTRLLSWFSLFLSFFDNFVFTPFSLFALFCLHESEIEIEMRWDGMRWHAMRWDEMRCAHCSHISSSTVI